MCDGQPSTLVARVRRLRRVLSALCHAVPSAASAPVEEETLPAYDTDELEATTRFIEDDEASPLGLGRAGGEITWSTPIEVDQPLAAMIAVYQPNDGELSLPYRLQLSLVPQNAPCPSPAQDEDSP